MCSSQHIKRWKSKSLQKTVKYWSSPRELASSHLTIFCHPILQHLSFFSVSIQKYHILKYFMQRHKHLWKKYRESKRTTIICSNVLNLFFSECQLIKWDALNFSLKLSVLCHRERRFWKKEKSFLSMIKMMTVIGTLLEFQWVGLNPKWEQRDISWRKIELLCLNFPFECRSDFVNKYTK